MKTRLIPRLLIVIVMPVLAGYGFFVSTAGLKGVSNRDFQRPSPTGSDEAKAWLFNQRAYPTGSIPGGATETAWRVSMQAVASKSQMLDDLTVADQWTNIGPAPINSGQLIAPTPTATPRVTGRIVGIAVDPNQSGHWFVAASSGGIWETADAGGTWTPKTDGEASLVTNTITIAPSNSNILFSGLTNITNTGVGLLKSIDGGASWVLQATANFAGRPGFYFAAVRVHPTHPNIVLAMTSQETNPETGGVFKSIDGGASFGTPTLAGGGTALEINPTNFSQQYAALRNHAGNNPSNGIFRSLDGGNTWGRINGPWDGVIGWPGGPVRMAIGSSAAPGTIYVGVPTFYGPPAVQGGMWKTDNAWDPNPTWTPLVPANPGGTDAVAVLVDPGNANIFYAGGGGELPGFAFHRYNHTAMSWTSILASTHVDQQALAAEGSTLLLGNDGGFWISTNQGTTWTNKNSNLGVVQFYTGSINPNDATSALGGSQDNGTELFTGSALWQFQYGGDGSYNAFSKFTPNAWVLSSQYLNVLRTLDGGIHIDGAATGITGGGANWVAPIRRSPDSDIVFAGSDNMWKSTNFFTAATPTWTSNGPDMPMPITAIAIASQTRSMRYAYGTGTIWSYPFFYLPVGELRLTTNGGATWTDLDPQSPQMPQGGVPNRPVTEIAFHPTNPDVIYVALSGFDANFPGHPGHIFKTENATANPPTWTNVSPGPAGQPAVDLPMNALAIDPLNPNTVFAGSDLGVWKSTTGGSSWTFMGPGKGMPNVPVTELTYGPDGHLVAFTYGRGAFKLNVGSLQVTLAPPGAVSAGAKWKVDNGAMQDSGTIVTGLAPGNHTVSFGPAAGFTPPASQTVTISLNQTTTTTGVYFAWK